MAYTALRALYLPKCLELDAFSEVYRGAVEKLSSVLADAEAGPLGVPEEDHPAIGQDIRHPDEVPLSSIAGIESLLDLPQTVGVLVQHQLLSVVAPVALFGHKPFPLFLVHRHAVYAQLAPARDHAVD
jgi:hypothetical protein